MISDHTIHDKRLRCEDPYIMDSERINFPRYIKSGLTKINFCQTFYETLSLFLNELKYLYQIIHLKSQVIEVNRL